MSVSRLVRSVSRFPTRINLGISLQRTATATLVSCRALATGTRGSRGHGWYVNYRAGKGGRHLQGEYFDRDVEECQQWNQAILDLGSSRVYLDIVQEPHSKTRPPGEFPSLNELTGTKHRITIDLASTVMPETCQNFMDLCTLEREGYKGSVLYRVERNVGFCGGDVLTNTGKTGKAAKGTPLQLSIDQDPLVLWHVAGTVTMLVPNVGRVDSRFVLCTQSAFHLDGINRALGQMTQESLEIVTGWGKNLLTKNGVPSSYDLIVVDSGVVGTDEAEAVSA